MWVYVLYGSRTEGTARIARAIASAVEWSNEYGARPVQGVRSDEIRGPGLIFLGCHSGGSELERPIRHLLDGMIDQAMYHVVWAIFDTRSDPVPVIAGSGVRRLRRAVEHRGGRLVFAPQSFFAVDDGTTVPPTEVERARNWASTAIAAAVRIYRDPEVRPGVLSGITLEPAWQLSLAHASWPMEAPSGPGPLTASRVLSRPLRVLQ